MPRVVQRLGERHAHLRSGGEHAVEPGQHHHADDPRHPTPFLAHPLRPGPGELDFAGRIGPVAQLVLQPHQPQRVELPIGQAPRQQEAGQAARRLRQHQEAVGHRCGEEPLVPDQTVRAGAVQRRGDGGVAAHVRAALLLGHAHAQGDAGLVGDRHIARVVVRRGGLVGPFAQGRVLAQHRDRGMGHGQRATGAGFGLVVQVAQRRTRHMRARLRAVPGQPGHAMALGRVQQLVIGRVKLDRVDAVAVAVVRAQPRTVAVGVEAKPI
ncbi:hypothetical protein NB706_003435 [Xanthomonas sacchari]|nr:hypothetical protein [Xanthomonas sacchari]